MTRHFTIIASFVLVSVLTAASGLMHGRMTDRWGPSPAILAAAERLEKMPTKFGDWELVEPDQPDTSVVNMLELVGYVGGTYVNRNTDARVYAALILGPPGTIAVHTPEICVSSRANVLIETRKSVSIEPAAPQTDDAPLADTASQPAASPSETAAASPQPPHRFWRVVFKRADANGLLMPVYYGWTISGRWDSSERPRFEFADNPYLFKLQVSSVTVPGIVESQSNPCEEFLAEFTHAAEAYVK